MATRQPLLPDWWGTKHSILSAVVGTLVIVGIITAVHFSGNAGGSADVTDQDAGSDSGQLHTQGKYTWNDADVKKFVSAEVEAGRFASEVGENLELVEGTEIPCGKRYERIVAKDQKLQYVSTNIITLEKVDLQFADIQTLTRATSSRGRWNPLVKCDVMIRGSYVGQMRRRRSGTLSRHGVGMRNYGAGAAHDQQIYRGQWAWGRRSGIGEYVFDGLFRNSYLGEWKHNVGHGDGKYYLGHTNKTYSGKWKDGKLTGMVIITSDDGTSEQKDCSVIKEYFHF
eukprot:930661_1